MTNREKLVSGVIGTLVLAGAAMFLVGAVPPPTEPLVENPVAELEPQVENSVPKVSAFVPRKRVIAHYMSNMLYHKGAYSVPTYDAREHFRLDGPSAAIGGFNQTFPIMDFRKTDMTPEEAAEFEVKTAMRLGIDGFQFFYPLSPPKQMQHYNDNIKAFFRAVDRLGVDFKLTVCLCMAEQDLTEGQKIRLWGDPLKDLLSEPSWDDIWLKTADGKHIIYQWIGDGLSDQLWGIGDILKNPNLMDADVEAYERLADYCGIDAAYVYHVRWWMLKHTDVIAKAVEEYPAFWSFDPLNIRYAAQWDAFAKQCNENGKFFTASICPDFYTSKLYRKNTDIMFDRIWKLEDALALGVDGMYRRAYVTGLSQELRASAERAIEFDAPLINVVTWNDYPEGHQVCPDINHNFSFALLIQAYKNIWIGQPELNECETGMVFFKKYPSTVRPSLADFEVRSEDGVPLSEDDFIEAVTILHSPAELFINNRSVGEVPAGISTRRIPAEPGPVSLRAVRGGATVFELTAPEWITDHPYRTDRLTVGYSSEFSNLWKNIFGNKPPVSACEYAEDEPGIPNWTRGIHLTDEIEDVQ